MYPEATRLVPASLPTQVDTGPLESRGHLALQWIPRRHGYRGCLALQWTPRRHGYRGYQGVQGTQVIYVNLCNEGRKMTLKLRVNLGILGVVFYYISFHITVSNTLGV